MAEWREAERADLVRLRIEPEQENYFDVYGKPDNDQEKARIERELERCDCWWIVAEVNEGDEITGDKWEHADSIGMCVYDNPLDPFENDYIPDLMRAALDAVPVPGAH